MIDLGTLPTVLIVPAMLGIYALAFIAGGIYYLEQQAGRLRDLFPKSGLLPSLIGWTALGIGLLAALSIGGVLLDQGAQFGYGALTSTAAGHDLPEQGVVVVSSPVIADGCAYFLRCTV